MRLCIALCVLSVVTYVYLAFATTALVAQHRGLQSQMAELATDRSASEYAFQSASETLFARRDANELRQPDEISFISLSSTTSVAFAQE